MIRKPKLFVYLLGESGQIGGEACWVINEEVVVVAVADKGVEIGNKVVIEVDSVDHGVEALTECVGVVLKAGDGAKEERLP